MASMPFNINEKVVCRVCLKMLDPTKNSFGFVHDRIGTLKDMIMNCIPEMDIYASPNPIVCFPCIQTLVSLHLFKNKCINTETIIRTYLKRKNLPADSQVDLVSVVEEMVTTGAHNGTVVTPQNTVMAQPPHIIGESSPTSLLNARLVSNAPVSKQMPCITPLSTAFHRPKILKTYSKPKNQAATKLTLLKPPPPLKGSPQKQEFSQLRSMLSPKGQPKYMHHPYLPVPNTINKNKLVVVNGNPYTLPMETPVETLTVDLSEVDDAEDPKKVGEEVVEEVKDKETPPEIKVHPIEQKMRLIVKIPRTLIHIPKKKEDEIKKPDDDIDNDDVTEMIAENPSEEQESLDGDPTDTETALTDEPSYYERILSCPYCTHVSKRPFALNKHINTVHTKSVWYACQLCDYETTDNSSLRRHERTVHRDIGGKNLDCKFCGEIFGNFAALKYHMAKHNSAQYKCQFCAYSSRDRSNYRKHIFTHNPISTQCEFCDYKCVSPYLLKSHLKRQHNSVGIDEVDCKGNVPIKNILHEITTAIEEASKEDASEMK